mmetsp:Transcript_13603/g.21646  ORF Transcript_13603/g.21646 Transcript_13603/m.21646 type:complete len:918 (+) Transcript_13603:122-2875(+)
MFAGYVEPGQVSGYAGHVALDVASAPADVQQLPPLPQGHEVALTAAAAFAQAGGLASTEVANYTSAQNYSPAGQTLQPRSPPVQLAIHRIEGALCSSAVSPVVRVHVVDAASGFWRAKAAGQHAIFNLDADGQPYLRSGAPQGKDGSFLSKDRGAVAPWAADNGQSAFIRPFSTLPCPLLGRTRGAPRPPPRWDEAFLLAGLAHTGSVLLFEVLDAVTAPETSLEGGQVKLLPLGWGFLNADAALAVGSRPRPRRLRIQLFKYQRRRGMACADGLGLLDEEDGQPAVVREYLGAGHGDQELRPGMLASALLYLTGRSSGRREPWPAALEVSLSLPKTMIELDKAAEVHSKLNDSYSRLSRVTLDSHGGVHVASAIEPAEDPGQKGTEELLGKLAPHNLRHDDQPCALPDSLLWQIPAGKGGASRLALSPSGRLLAAAVSRGGGASELRVFSLATSRLHATCAPGHDALVYDLCWHAFPGRTGANAHPLLISCGGDGVVLIFEVPEDLQLAGPNAPQLRPQAKLNLPSHVYSVRPHPSLSADPRRLVLMCGGHGFGLMLCEVARLWKQDASGHGGSWIATTPHVQKQVSYEVSSFRPGAASPEANRNPEHPSDVLCVRFSTQAASPDNLYVTDAAGHVMLFQVRFDAALEAGRGGVRATLVRSYAAPELSGTPIYGMEVVTQQLVRGRRLGTVQLSMVDDWALLFSRDHIVRLASLQRGVLKIELEMSGLECGSYPVMGAMSPDGAYVASGSETGELLMWSAADGSQLPAASVPQVRLAGPMMDVVWSERHHLVACCALDEQAPPLLVFVGGDPDAQPPTTPPRRRNVAELPHRPAPLCDAPREELAFAFPSSITPAATTNNKWASQWLNADENPRSAITLDEKRRMKENILLQLLDRKGTEDMENHFASVRALPGGM